MNAVSNPFLARLLGRLQAAGAQIEEYPIICASELGSLRWYALRRPGKADRKFIVIDQGEDGYTLYPRIDTLTVDEDLETLLSEDAAS